MRIGFSENLYLMKHFLLTCCLSSVFCYAFAVKTQTADPTLISSVGETRATVACAPVTVPEENVSLRSFSEKAFSSGIVFNSEADPAFRPKANASVNLSSLVGNKKVWATSYSSYDVSSFSTEIKAAEGGGYTMSPFFFNDVSISFTVDAETGAVSIPVQKVSEVDGNVVSLCKVDLDKGVFSPTDALTGMVSDGAIFIDDAYGFFVTEGPQFGAYLTVGIFKHTVAGVSNATFHNNAISFTNNEMTVANRKVTAADYESFVYTTATDAIKIVNVPVNASKRGELTLTLTSQGTIIANPQPATVINPLGEFFYYGLKENVASDGKISFSASMLSPIEMSYNASTGVLAMPCWGVARTGALLSFNESSTITLPFSPEFPKVPALDLAGSGTKEDPWLLKSAMDFVALGAAVQTNVEARGPRELVLGTTDEYCYPVYKDKYFKLANDVDFSVLDRSYTPIGTKTLQFAGNLDGAGFAINNLTITDYAYDYCGLFGVQSPHSTIENITVTGANVHTLGYTAGALAGYAHGLLKKVSVIDSNITARAGYNAGGVAGYTRNVSEAEVSGTRVQAMGYVGGLCGRSYGDITDCKVQANVVMTSKQMFGGGIVGHQSKTTANEPNHTVSGCSFSGTVQSPADQIGLGGIAGAFSYAVMDGCYANAVVLGVSGVQTYMGGLAGTVFDAQIKNSYASGFVRNDASTTAGGLIGHVTSSTSGDDTSTMKGCYSSVMLTTASTDPMRGIIGDNTRIAITDCYYDAQIAAVENATCGLTTDSLTSGNAPKGFDADKWVFTKGLYPRVKGSEDSAIAAVSSAALVLPAGQTVKAVEEDFTYSLDNGVAWSAAIDGKLNDKAGYAFTFDNGIGRLNYEQQTDTIFVQKGNASKYYIVNIAPVLFEGKGTAEEPWKISTKADLTKLSEMSVKAALTFEGKYLTQTADIDMEGSEILPICKDATAKLQFQGSYDGAGHKIDNMKIQSVGFFTAEDVTGTAVVGQVNPKNAKSYSWGGLFATVGASGVVKNLTIGSGCTLDFFQNGGAIAGGVYGTIENCYNYADTRTYYASGGGIAGQVLKGGVIKGCYNNGTVSVNANTAGGIVGMATSATVESCENTGTVKGENFNPYQKPDIQKTVGGIVGKSTSSVISDVVNSGEVVAFTEVGGILGNASGTAAAPGKVTNALNYGFITSKNSILSLGAVSGVNVYTEYASCVTDSRLQHIGLVANGAAEGVSALPTSEIAGNDKLFASGKWTVKAGSYPTVTLSNVPAQVALNSSAIVSWTGNEYAQAAVSGANLSSGQTWSVNGDKAFSVAGDRLNVTVPAEGVAEGVLSAEANGLVRKFYLKSFQFDVFDGDGSEQSPFIIATADDFLKLGSLVNTSGFNYSGYVFSQTADLDFAGKKFVPVGGTDGSFGGVYNGNNHLMKGVDYNNPTTAKTITTGGLFGIVDFTGVVSGLILDETSVIATQTNAGGIAGTLYGKIVNCVNKAKVSTYGATGAGGVAGYAYPGASLENCSNAGSVTAKTNYAGGILGQAPANARVSVKGCVNSGAVQGASKNGGVVGSASADIVDCSNSGAVTSTTTYSAGIIGEALATSSLSGCSNSGVLTSPQYIGGIVAMSTAHTAAAPLNISGCYNTADITAGAKGYAGGLGGSLNNYVNISKCYNTGNVSGSATTTGGIRLAGLVSSGGKYTTFTDCYNTGNISGYSNSGGVVGYSGDSTKLTDCYNTGNVTGGYATATNIGGVVGSGPCAMTRCYNTGNIEGAGYQVGGLNGQNTTSTNPIVDCFNAGNVKGATKTGGLIGMGRGQLNGCVNFGKVTATNEAAGIIGVPGNAAAASYTTTIDNCLSLGVVESDGANTAAVVANNTSCKYLKLANNYFDSSVLSATNNDKLHGDAVKGLSSAELAETEISSSFEKNEACYPMLKAMADNGIYGYYSALVLFAKGETASEVKSPFNVGTPAKVVWTSSDNLAVDGNKVTLKASAISQAPVAAWIKKSFGDLSQTYELTVYATASAVADLDADSDVVNVTYYTLDGRSVAEPQPGEVTVRRAVKANGEVVVSKVLVRK